MNLTSDPAGPPEDTGCTRCEGEGWITDGIATRAGKTQDVAHACHECDGDGTGYTQWANGFGPYAQAKEP